MSEKDVVLSEEVIAAIARLAVSEVPGISGLHGSLIRDLGQILGRKGGGRGVRVEMGSREVAIDLYVHVRYGRSIPAAAQEVQEKVKEAVEKMTGLKVVEVNVHVKGVTFEEAPERKGKGLGDL
ncbi:MAG: Asp23/Gls24 family envelope stress response protein [Clostridiales bacterium]|nr:Asp23/Gls24 family envelope stress response protein [Clostridiales bacterium]